MRKIKFRAWNVKENFMDSAWLIDWEHEKVCHSNHNQSDLNDCVLMQYTGLKDSTKAEEYPEGIEIYESDILCDPITNNYYIVTYDEGYAQFFLKNIDESPNKPDYYFSEYDNDVCNDLYVMGNTYENPELQLK